MYLHTGSSPAIPSKKKSSNFRKVNRNLPTPSSPAITVCSQASAARISNCCCRDGKGAQIATKRCAGLTTPSAPLRSLRDLLLMAQPPLLCEEGNASALTVPVRDKRLHQSVDADSPCCNRPPHGKQPRLLRGFGDAKLG